ncbi:MAG: FtsX-like permease family protein, partial [Sphingopyxis sp.]|nr:FtsX-like permease family protein [Sphingopyxis sp.]
MHIALGATAWDVLRMVLRSGIVLVGVGIGLGLAAAWGLTRFMAGMLYGVSATDPITFASVASVLAASALLASYVPARRATRVDPVRAL